MSKGQNINFKLKIYKKLLDAIYPSFSVSENIIFKGIINSNESNTQFVLDAPFIKYKENQFEKLHFEIDTKNTLFNSYLSVKNISNKYFKGKDFNLISTKLKDTLFFRSEFNGKSDSKSKFEVNFYHTAENQGISYFGVKKSIIPIISKAWTINPENLNNQKISYSLKK